VLKNKILTATIQNIGIEQPLKNRQIPLTVDRANNWFNEILGTIFEKSLQKIEVTKTLMLDNLGRNKMKKPEKT
jgi:hypothetical protein